MRFIPYFLLLITSPALANQAAGTADFLAAHDAFLAGDTVKLERYAQRLNNTPLEVYARYYQLSLSLKSADQKPVPSPSPSSGQAPHGKLEGPVKNFLSRPEDTPMIDQLRGEWLRLLGKKQQWDLFDAEYPRALNEDAELTCYILQSRLRNHDQTALREARALWFSGKGQPESCSVPFETAISAGVITGQDIRQRLRLAFESGNVSLAKQLFARLDGDQAVPSKALESAASDTVRYLDKLKLDDPKSLIKPGSLTKTQLATAQAKPSMPVEAHSVPVSVKFPPFRKLTLDYPLTSSLPSGARTKSISSYLESPEAQHRLSGQSIAPTQAQTSRAKPSFFITPEFYLGYRQAANAKGGQDDIASGCLNFTPVLPDSGFPVLAMQNAKSPESYICPNPCRIFSISALLTMQRNGVDASQNRLSLSDLQLVGIDMTDVESILAKFRPSNDKQTMPAAPSLGNYTQLEFSSKGLEASTSGSWSGWSSLWNWIGLGKTDEFTAISTDSGLRASAECYSCATEGEVSTVPPIWNSKLASEGQRAVVLFALQRLAKQSPELAAARWTKIAAFFPADEQHYFYGWLAYEAARNLDGRALQWFKAAADTPLNEQQSAWRVRAALREQDWPEVLASINAMSEQQQREPAWIYWKARGLKALGKAIEARDLFAPLSSEHHFYGQLAGDELADTQVLSQTMATYKPDNQAIAELLALPGMQRTLALYRMGLRNEALEEWRWVLRNFNDRELLTAAEIARRNEMYDRAIGAADKTVHVHDFSLRYLAPYRPELHAHIREHGLDEAWVYGLMRQESRFVTSAKSDTGASGLMQIMPATARWIAKKLGLKSYRNALIHQLDTNLRLGTYYMKTVLSQSDNSPVLASASYNAGPTKARQWRGEKPLEGAIYIETIPFEETRDYVKKVMSNTVYYADQFGDPPRSLKQRLGIIAARTTDNPQAAANVP